MISKDAIGKGVSYLYVEALTMMISGYVYWLILSKIMSPSIIGISSTVISLMSIFMTIASLGIVNGIQSFLGKSFLNVETSKTRIIIVSSFILVGIGISTSTIIILILNNWISHTFKIDFALVLFSVFMMGTFVISNLLRSIIIPSLQTRIITTSSIIATIIKIVLTIILVILGLDVWGILIGFISYPILSIIFFAKGIKNIFAVKYDFKDVSDIIHPLKEIFIASFGFWLPLIINTVGSQLGTISVFVSSGASNAGIYFIAFSIATGITLILTVLSTIAYPTVSSIKDGRKRAVWKLIKISMILTMPLSMGLIFYSSDIMQLFGQNYVDGSITLDILLLSIFPTSIITGISVLVYAYDDHKLVLIIGLFTSVPRTLLYFFLVPILDSNGAALSYLIGSLIGLIASVIVANSKGLNINWKQSILIVAIPSLFLISFQYLNIHPVIGIVLTLSLTYIILLKTKIMNREDVEDISKALPKQFASTFQQFIIKIYDKMEKK